MFWSEFIKKLFLYIVDNQSVIVTSVDSFFFKKDIETALSNGAADRRNASEKTEMVSLNNRRKKEASDGPDPTVAQQS